MTVRKYLMSITDGERHSSKTKDHRLFKSRESKMRTKLQSMHVFISSCCPSVDIMGLVTPSICLIFLSVVNCNLELLNKHFLPLRTVWQSFFTMTGMKLGEIFILKFTQLQPIDYWWKWQKGRQEERQHHEKKLLIKLDIYI